MALKKTHLLSDDPAVADEFGTHKKIADLISAEIQHAENGRSIALVGDWGSGKSTIIELLRSYLNGASTHLFIYDAWSHQGDSLRRAFLDDLSVSLKNLLPPKALEEVSERIWNRAETTTVTRQPIMRWHAKVLLFCVAFIPLGMKLFSLPQNLSLVDGLSLPQNIVAYVLLLAPVLATCVFSILNWLNILGMNKALFGTDEHGAKFSVFSFFVEKSQGQIERKHIKTPADSIVAFRDVFDFILAQVGQRNNEQRVVIVIDNIDRITSEQARDFWSTMQTFFGDSGGIRRAKTTKYWLIAPFSVQALSSIFRNDDTDIEGQYKAKAYIDKTFGLAFYVPPPILTNWRRYLLAKLDEAFPEHDRSELVGVRDAYDFARIGQSITPRDMKLFVNETVALYRQRGEDVSLPTIAVYALHRSKIIGTSIDDDLLQPSEKRLIDGSDWRTPIAALHFGVGIEQASQLLLQDPIILALREKAAEKLRSLQDRFGFVDVLHRALADELGVQSPQDGTAVASIGSTLGALDNIDSAEFLGIWRQLRTQLRSVTNWQSCLGDTADGVRLILAHALSSEREVLCNAVSASMFHTNLPTIAGLLQEPYPQAANWLRTATEVISSLDGRDNNLVFYLPGDPQIQLELLQQVADLSDSRLKNFFKTKMVTGDLVKALEGEITDGRYPRAPTTLVTLLAKIVGPDAQWTPIISACTNKLRSNNTDARETISLVNLLLSVGLICRSEAALRGLKDLSIEGYLSHLMFKYRKNGAVSATLVTATIISNPNFERPNQFEQSSGGDELFNKISDSSVPDAESLDRVAQLVHALGAASVLFQSTVLSSKTGRLSAAVFGKLSELRLRFDIEPDAIVAQRAFFEQFEDVNPISQFLPNLLSSEEIADVLVRQPFEVGKSQLCRAVLEMPPKRHAEAFQRYLEEQTTGLEKSDWEAAIIAEGGSYLELLKLAVGLQKFRSGFELSPPARDAMLSFVRSVATGKIEPSAISKDHFVQMLRLLPDNLRSSLIRDIIDDLISAADGAQTSRTIGFMGDFITLGADIDADRVLRRIFVPMLESLTEQTADWMAKVIAMHLAVFKKLLHNSKKEFEARIATQLEDIGDSKSTVGESLREIVRLLDLDVTLDAAEKN